VSDGGAPVIEVESLVREFVVRRSTGRLRRRREVVRAIDGITFAVPQDSSVGYIGANGAGKSTTIKMITGILQPSAGTVRTFGLDPMRHRREVARRVGVVFGQRSQLWWDLPLAESFTILAALHRLRPPAAAARRDELAERLELGHLLASPVRQLSLGERMRGELAAALLHSPDLLILDEPTIGLDVLSKERLRVFLAEENRTQHRTMLLTTHDMDDVERLCDRLIVVDHGRLAFDGSASELAATVGARRVLMVDLFEPHTAPIDIAALPGVEALAVEADGLRHRFAFALGDVSAAQVLARVGEQAEVRDLSIEEPDIEDVVRRLYLASGR
jgi:ABC-2 type transport system ATP-binding protein